MAVGHAVHGARRVDDERDLRAGGARALSYAPGATLADAAGSGPPQDRLDAYFNVAAFRDSGDAWGDTGRNILRGPSQRQIDISLSRQLPIFGRQQLELRWDVFNALNEPVFANPASTFAANGPATPAASPRPSADRGRCSSG